MAQDSVAGNQSGRRAVGSGRNWNAKADLPAHQLLTEISLCPAEQGSFDLSAALHVELAGIGQAIADSLVEAAHAVYPYSNATRGNVPVTIDAIIA